MNAVFVLTPTRPSRWGRRERRRKMNTQTDFVEIQDAQLQERVTVVVEDKARTAEQILNEQAAEREADENTSAPRYLP
jgi:hypothetical protein